MKWYYWLFIIIFILLGIWTLIPSPASKPCLLGYYAHCSFSPISTIICFIISGIFYWLGKRAEKKKEIKK
jgi:quinol-cytochrome oxidoreductase complex cytochrome b subunit